MKPKRNNKLAPAPSARKPMVDPHVGAGSSPKKNPLAGLFAPPDPKYDRQCLKRYYLNEFLSDDVDRDGDEEAARGAMFDRLAKLAKVVKAVKKKRK